MSWRQSFLALTCTAFLVGQSESVQADSSVVGIGGTQSSVTTGLGLGSTTAYYGFKREQLDGTTIDGDGMTGTTVPVAGSVPDLQRIAFLADPSLAALAVGVEDFESFADGAVGTVPLPLSLTFGGGSGLAANLITNIGSISEITTPGAHTAGRYPTSGTKFLNTDNPVNNVTLTFLNPVSAFGFYATDAGDFEGHLTLEVTQQDAATMAISTTTFEVPNPHSFPGGGTPVYNASLLFFGLIDVDKPITKVTFINATQSTEGFNDERYGLDDFIAVSSTAIPPVPEPGTFGLLLLGGSALLGYSRRKKRAHVGLR